MGFGGFCWDTLGYGGICWDMLGYVKICWDLVGFGWIWWDMVGYGGICEGGGLHVVRRPCTCFAKVSLLSPMVSTFA